jgi:hypothetical protein
MRLRSFGRPIAPSADEPLLERRNWLLTPSKTASSADARPGFVGMKGI